MKKSDIIKLVKETVAERRKRYGQHDYYGNNVGGRNSISGMPGVWEGESTSFKVVNADTGKTIDFGIDQAKAEEIVAAAKEDNINTKVVKMKNADDVGKLKETQGTLASDMLNYADQYHMELVNTMKGVSTHPDKRTGGFRILFPHENGPGPGALFGKGVRMQIEKSKAAAKAAALKTVSKFQDQIEDYEISDSSPAGVYGSIHLWIMPSELGNDYTAPKGGTQSSQFEDKQNKNKMKKIKEATYAGKTAVDDMTNDPAYNALDGDAKMQLKKDLSQGGTATLEEDDGAHLAGEFDKISRSLKDKGGYIGDERLEDLMKTRGTADVSLWHIAKLEEVGIINDSNKAEALKAVGHQGGNALAEYMKERGDSNLMEHMDRHRKRTRLMEGAVKRLFIDFDLGKTNEEIIQDYATKGIQIPDSWISQMRKEWEGFEKMKLNLDIGEKEFKNAATQIVNNPEGSETGMEPPMESKQLANGLTN